ncbi:MAG: type IV pilin protein [Nitrospiraceae bacterium]
MKALPRQAGFSLIELMVVVAIAGIIAAIAIPNFLQYQAKSRQAEARVSLGGVFVAEAAFFAGSARYGGFPQIGFGLAGAANRYTYRSVSTDATGTAAPQAGDTINAVIGTVDPEGVPGSASSVSGFTATAAANLDSDLIIDQWHVNDIKQGLRVPDMNDVGS